MEECEQWPYYYLKQKYLLSYVNGSDMSLKSMWTEVYLIHLLHETSCFSTDSNIPTNVSILDS